MTIDMTEAIRKALGWCPLEDGDFRQVHRNGLIHSHISNVKSDPVGGRLVNEIRAPLDMTDWRKFAIILVLGVSVFFLIIEDFLNRTAAAYFGIITLYFIFIVLFNILDWNKVSIDSEKLMINTSFFESIKIPKHNINSIKIIDNVLHKYNWVNFILIILTLLLGFAQTLSLYRQIMRSSVLEDALLSIANATFVFLILISIFYRSNRRSHYPKAIQVEAGTKNITLYPINEFEFNILKEELER